MNDFDEYLVAGEPSKRDRAYGWATAIGLHRHDVVENSGGVGINVGINVGIKHGVVLSHTEENAVKAILRDDRVTAKVLSVVLGVTLRQAERIIASLKRKANLHREGSRKNGRWVFGEDKA